jgi:hypothetical protein
MRTWHQTAEQNTEHTVTEVAQLRPFIWNAYESNLGIEQIKLAIS